MSIGELRDLAYRMEEMGILEMTPDEIREEAIQSACDCYKSELVYTDHTLREMVGVIQDGYYLHESYDECPEWLTERDEDHSETQSEMERGN